MGGTWHCACQRAGPWEHSTAGQREPGSANLPRQLRDDADLLAGRGRRAAVAVEHVALTHGLVVFRHAVVQRVEHLGCRRLVDVVPVNLLVAGGLLHHPFVLRRAAREHAWRENKTTHRDGARVQPSRPSRQAMEQHRPVQYKRQEGKARSRTPANQAGKRKWGCRERRVVVVAW